MRTTRSLSDASLWRFIFVVSILCITAGDVFAIAQPYRIALVADPHIGDAYDQNFQDVIKNVNQVGVSEVLVAGDLTTGGSGQTAQFTKYNQMIKGQNGFTGFAAPVLSIAGNHDVGDKYSPNVVVSHLSGSRLTIFQSSVGPLYFSQTLSPGLRVVGATSSIMGSSGLNDAAVTSAENAQWTFLQNNLPAATPGELVILLVHYPIFISDPNEGNQYWNLDTGPRAELLQLLTSTGTDLVLTGHLHHALQNTYGNTLMIGAPAVSFGVPEAGETDPPPTGWTLLTINPDGSIIQDIRFIPPIPEPGTIAFCSAVASFVPRQRPFRNIALN